MWDADAHNAANAAENERVMEEASGSQGTRRSTARSRTADRENATMMFREAMGERLAGGEAVGMQGPSGTTQRRRSTSQAGRRSTSHAGPSGTSHQQGETVQPARRSTSQLGERSTYGAGPSSTAHQAQADPSGTADRPDEAVQPARRSTPSWGSRALKGLQFRMSRKTK